MATNKLLANSNRWNDDGVFSRDLIDLAMMSPSLPLLRLPMKQAGVAAALLPNLIPDPAAYRIIRRLTESPDLMRDKRPEAFEL